MDHFYKIQTLSIDSTILTYITELNALFTFIQSLLTNDDHINTVGAKQESITTDNSYYRWTKIIVILNQIENS